MNTIAWMDRRTNGVVLHAIKPTERSWHAANPIVMHVMVHDVILGKVNGNRKQGRRRAMLMKRWCEGEEGPPPSSV